MRGPATAALTVALLAAPAARAEPVATLYSHNGSLPPPYHRNLTAEIDRDGTVTLTACKGYGDDDCETVSGTAPAEAIAAIETAARQAGLPGSPLRENPDPPVGGGAVTATVVLDGATATLPAFVRPEDEARKAAVIAAIEAAIPADLSSAASSD